MSKVSRAALIPKYLDTAVQQLPSNETQRKTASRTFVFSPLGFATMLFWYHPPTQMPKLMLCPSKTSPASYATPPKMQLMVFPALTQTRDTLRHMLIHPYARILPEFLALALFLS